MIGDSPATITRHLPAYFSGYDDVIESFGSIEELLEIDWVKDFGSQPKFHQYSISDKKGYSNLMAEFEDGCKWYVVGYLSNAQELMNGLPDWHPKYK